MLIVVVEQQLARQDEGLGGEIVKRFCPDLNYSWRCETDFYPGSINLPDPWDFRTSPEDYCLRCAPGPPDRHP